MLGLCDNLDKAIIEKFIIVIKIIIYYCDNSKFPDTIVYYTKHTNTLVHRAILELQNPKYMHLKTTIPLKSMIYQMLEKYQQPQAINPS